MALERDHVDGDLLREVQFLRERVKALEEAGLDRSRTALTSPLSEPDTAGRDVSTRVVESLVTTCRKRGIDPARLVEGTRLTVESLGDFKTWLDWASFVRLMKNAEGAIGVEGLREAGRAGLDTPAVRLFRVVGWTLGSEMSIIRWGSQQVFGEGGLFYRSLDFEARQLSRGRIQARVRERFGREVPPALGEMFGSAFAMLPTLIGRGEARVTRVDQRDGFDVTLELSRSWLDEIRSAIQRGATELFFENALEETRAAYEALRVQSIELEHYLRALRAVESRRAQLEEQLRHAQTLEAVGRLAAGVAHDFNNLLTIVLSHADFLSQEPLSDAARGDVDRLLDAAQRAARLTRQLLALSRQQVLTLEVISVRDLLLDLEGMVRSAVGERVRVRLQIAADLPSVKADRSQLESVLLNLVVNARDAMPDGGSLTVSAGLEPGQSGAADQIVITVRDSGIGIDPEVQKRIFEPFFTTKPGGRGTGLGLATVHGIVHQLGGSIAVESKPGQGSAFVVKLPAARELAADVAKGASGSTSRAARPLRVLLVEDEAIVRRTVRSILSRAGHQVSEAPNAEAALELLPSLDAIDVLLTDVTMPGMSGHELARTVAAQRPDTRIILMSGYADSAGGGDESVADVTLPKPFTSAELVQAIGSGVRGKS